jgi:plasmid replication initiation protein
MNDLDRLIALEEIRTLEARRGRLLDTQDWAAYAELHVPEITTDIGAPEPLQGAAAMIDWLREQLAGAVTVHHVHSPDISFTSEDTAHGVWAMEAMTHYRRVGSTAWRHGYGFYYVDYERREGVWKIAGRRQERVRVDTGETSLPA